MINCSIRWEWDSVASLVHLVHLSPVHLLRSNCPQTVLSDKLTLFSQRREEPYELEEVSCANSCSLKCRCRFGDDGGVAGGAADGRALSALDDDHLPPLHDADATYSYAVENPYYQVLSGAGDTRDLHSLTSPSHGGGLEEHSMSQLPLTRLRH